MKPNRLSLELKFSIAVILLIVFTMIGIAVLIFDYQKSSLRQAMFESNLAMTRNLAHDAAESLLVYDPLRLDELVNTVLDATSCTYATIIDGDGKTVAHTRRGRLGTTLSPQSSPELIRILADGQEFIKEYSVEHDQVKEFSAPIRIGSEVLGVATVAYSMKKIDAAIEAKLLKLKQYLYVIAGFMMFAGIAGAFAVSNFLTRPIRLLKHRMLNIQTGNLDVEIENPLLVKCWERLHCGKEDCPAYGKLRCWAIAGTFCHGTVQGQFAQKIGDCRTCIVYKESCGDEINELVEVFNQMVKDLKHNLNELEEANREKARMERLSALGEMATTVAHETKNPLNSIRLATSYLKKNFEGEILTEFLSIIEEEVMRLNDMTTNFLGFSKPAPLKLKTCDINEIVKHTVELIRHEATDRNIEVIVLVDEHIPPIQCDFSRMKQALLNLLINAMDASGEGGTIMVTTESSGGSLKISVQDSGRGIRPEDVEKIFKPFYTTKTRGSGLGLAIVDRIIKEHGGRIEVGSAPDKGATFTMDLPSHEYAKT